MRLTDVLNSLIPDNKAAGWDPIGIQIGDPAADVGSIAVCHEVSEEVVDRLVEDPPDAVVAYHPLLFRPVTSATAFPSTSNCTHVRPRCAPPPTRKAM